MIARSLLRAFFSKKTCSDEQTRDGQSIVIAIVVPGASRWNFGQSETMLRDNQYNIIN